MTDVRLPARISRKQSPAPSALAAIFLLFCLCHAPAQGLGKLIEGLVGGGASSSETKEPPAGEQLVWAKERAREAREKIAKFEGEEFGVALANAGWPAGRAEEFRNIAVETAEAWEASVTLLDGLVLEQKVSASASAPEFSIPESPEEAAKLESQLESSRLQSANSLKEAQIYRRELAVASDARSGLEAAVANASSALESAQPGAAKASALLDLDLAKLRAGLGEAKSFYYSWAIHSSEASQAAADSASLAISRALDESAYNRLLDPSRIAQRSGAIEQARASLEKRFEEASAAHRQSAEALRTLQEKEGTKEGAADPEAAARLRTAMDSMRRLDSMRVAAQLLLEINATEKAEWQAVLEAMRTDSLGAWRAAKKQIESDVRQIETYRPRVDARALEVRSNLDLVERGLSAPGISQKEKTASEKLRNALTSQLHVVTELQSALSSLRSLQARLLAEIEARISEKSVAEKIASQSHRIGEAFAGFWSYPLLMTDGRAITVGKLSLAVLGLLAGVILAKWLALRFSLSMTGRFHLPEGQAHMLRTFFFYLVVVAFFLTTLNWLSIPLTVFAFLGGALMVGIGFGSQNLMNNFISGLILLIERKVSVGDIVEVDGHLGRIASLGSRCCSVRKFDGVEVLVPNSFLLEKNVVNWTLSDPNHRYDFVIGVAYGSPIKKVRELLLGALTAQPEVLTDPQPDVYFEEFADSSLNFHLYYWVRIGTCNALEVGSQIRCRIDSVLRDNNIEIPFPRRDLYIHRE